MLNSIRIQVWLDTDSDVGLPFVSAPNGKGAIGSPSVTYVDEIIVNENITAFIPVPNTDYCWVASSGQVSFCKSPRPLTGIFGTIMWRATLRSDDKLPHVR